MCLWYCAIPPYFRQLLSQMQPKWQVDFLASRGAIADKEAMTHDAMAQEAMTPEAMTQESEPTAWYYFCAQRPRRPDRASASAERNAALSARAHPALITARFSSTPPPWQTP
jgi:hypothetical protein